MEFFWGMVKKYLRNDCDYTFDTLKEILPKALRSVHIHTIRRSENLVPQSTDAFQKVFQVHLISIP